MHTTYFIGKHLSKYLLTAAEVVQQSSRGGVVTYFTTHS